DGVPERGAPRLAHGRGEREPPAPRTAREDIRGDRADHARGARARRPRRHREQAARGAVGRDAEAGRHRPRAGRRSGAHPLRRADGRPRPPPHGGDRKAHLPHPRPARQHADDRHAQPALGARDLRSDRGARRGSHRRMPRARRARREPSSAHTRVPPGVGARAREYVMLTNEQRIGIFFVVGLVLLFVAIELTLGLGLLHKRYPLYATFHDVQGLDVGADVRLAGIKAGRVAGMKIENGLVRVQMGIDGGLEVKKDSVATLDFRALSGDRYIALSLGTPTAKRAEPGDTLEGETPASFTEVVDKMSTVAASITDLADNLKEGSQRLLGNLADLVEENKEALGQTAQNLASITGKLDRGTGTLGKLVND